jgi:hypothetical protein
MACLSILHCVPGLVVMTAVLGCMPPRPIQEEIGTPTQRLDGRTLVILPRTCIVERSVPTYHFGMASIERTSPRTTTRVREILDALEPGAPRIDGRPLDTCSSPPDLDPEADVLSDLRASEDTLRLMRDRDAKYAVVLELHTVMACARSDGSFTYFGASGHADAFATQDDVCLEDEITLSAYVFEEDGSATFAITRRVGVNDDAGWAVDRVIERVPVTMPTRKRILPTASRSATTPKM